MDNQLSPPKSNLPSELPKRRNFIGLLAGGFAATLGASLVAWRFWPKGAINGLPAGLPPLPSRDAFATQLKSTFSIESKEPDAQGAKLDLTLVQVSDPKIQQAGERTFQSYSIIFEGSKSSMLTQQTCTMRHPALGTFDLFLVPIGRPKGNVVRYEAVFTIFQS